MPTPTPQEERIEDLMNVFYATKDFELATVVYCVAKDTIRFAGLDPVKDSNIGGRSKGSLYHVLFVGVDAEGNQFDPREEIETIRKQYINGDLKVDPKEMLQAQRLLRAAMHDSGPISRAKGSTT